MLLKLHITKEDIIEADYTISEDCPITRALRRAGIKGRSVVSDIYVSNANLPKLELFNIDDYHTSQHPLAIVNRRIIGMGINQGKYRQTDNPLDTPEPPNDINIEFEIDDIILTYK